MSEISVKRSKIETQARAQTKTEYDFLKDDGNGPCPGPCPWKFIRENAHKFERVQGTNSKTLFVAGANFSHKGCLQNVCNFETALVWALENGYHALSIELCKSKHAKGHPRDISLYGHRIRWLALRNGPSGLIPLLERYFNSGSENTISMFPALDRCDQERAILAMKTLTCKNYLPRVLSSEDMQRLISNCPNLASHYLRRLFVIYIEESVKWEEAQRKESWIRKRIETVQEYKKDVICEWLADICGKKRTISLLLLCARKHMIGSVWSDSTLPLDLFKRIFEDCGLFLTQ